MHVPMHVQILSLSLVGEEVRSDRSVMMAFGVMADEDKEGVGMMEIIDLMDSRRRSAHDGFRVRIFAPDFEPTPTPWIAHDHVLMVPHSIVSASFLNTSPTKSFYYRARSGGGWKFCTPSPTPKRDRHLTCVERHGNTLRSYPFILSPEMFS
ncbi:uncharacterized protein BDZ99DRAFT_286835 [Mytilinidion resinicola]|uniref:Uncharacterized protein n=1 Tax=Mytilinidion resinicola TaxID=574789 RepID=A0A6A6YQ69_9PEZI|nr:uncharacterized protein BDZ99DRAFT_286835 [Mytilinidion resinicola]KAF2810673.1 hypothetical protein BDZ99DRAFT_286835 [Mytilinidion resinicola]